MHREQTQPYRSTRFCFFFSRRRDRQLVCRSYVHSELVSFRVSTHACPGGTSPQVYLNGYMGVQVSRRTRMQIGSQLIQGRNNDNPPCSLPTIKRIFISPLLDPRYLAAFRKNSTTTSHLLPLVFIDTHVLLLQRRFRFALIPDVYVHEVSKSSYRCHRSWNATELDHRVKINALTKLRPCS